MTLTLLRPAGGAQVVEALAAHPQISCRGEVLNPIYEVYGDVRSRPWWRVRLHWRAMLLPTLPWPADVRAVGVKLFHVHTKPGAFACGATLAPLLESLEPRPVLFLLYRRCLISCYLSLSRAFETNVWWSAADSAPVPTATTPSTASVSGLAQYCEQERRLWREVLAELASAGWRKGDLHLFCYEDDVSTADGWVRENALPDLMADVMLASKNLESSFREMGLAGCAQRRARASMASQLGASADPSWLDRAAPSVVQRSGLAERQRRELLLLQLGDDFPQEAVRLDLPEMVGAAFG